MIWRAVKRWGLRTGGWLLGPGLDVRPRMLGYHAVGDGPAGITLPTGEFCRHIEWLLARGARFLTVRQWWDESVARRAQRQPSVILAFDDGYASVWRHAAPILAERGIVATVFAVTDYVGRDNGYDGLPPAQRQALMGWPELEALASRGWDIHAHTRRHPDLTRLDAAQLEDEVAGSRRILGERLGRPPEFFCYPYGLFNQRVVQAVMRAGYLGGVSCLAGALPEQPDGDDRWLLRRVMADSTRVSDLAACSRVGYRRIMQWRADAYRARHIA